jgi:predicted enzyme related to lactoylglutathione lyase
VGKGTIALHRIEPGQELKPGAIRLYFEVKDVEKFRRGLTDAGVALTGPPKVMPWGWTHVYLDDPDGQEVSIYSAGAKRFKATVMKKAAK